MDETDAATSRLLTRLVDGTLFGDDVTREDMVRWLSARCFNGVGPSHRCPSRFPEPLEKADTLKFAERVLLYVHSRTEAWFAGPRSALHVVNPSSSTPSLPSAKSSATSMTSSSSSPSIVTESISTSSSSILHSSNMNGTASGTFRTTTTSSSSRPNSGKGSNVWPKSGKGTSRRKVKPLPLAAETVEKQSPSSEDFPALGTSSIPGPSSFKATAVSASSTSLGPSGVKSSTQPSQSAPNVPVWGKKGSVDMMARLRGGTSSSESTSSTGFGSLSKSTNKLFGSASGSNNNSGSGTRTDSGEAVHMLTVRRKGGSKGKAKAHKKATKKQVTKQVTPIHVEEENVALVPSTVTPMSMAVSTNNGVPISDSNVNVNFADPGSLKERLHTSSSVWRKLPVQKDTSHDGPASTTIIQTTKTAAEAATVDASVSRCEERTALDPLEVTALPLRRKVTPLNTGESQPMLSEKRVPPKRHLNFSQVADEEANDDENGNGFLLRRVGSCVGKPTGYSVPVGHAASVPVRPSSSAADTATEDSGPSELGKIPFDVMQDMAIIYGTILGTGWLPGTYTLAREVRRLCYLVALPFNTDTVRYTRVFRTSAACVLFSCTVMSHIGPLLRGFGRRMVFLIQEHLLRTRSCLVEQCHFGKGDGSGDGDDPAPSQRLGMDVPDNVMTSIDQSLSMLGSILRSMPELQSPGRRNTDLLNAERERLGVVDLEASRNEYTSRHERVVYNNRQVCIDAFLRSLNSFEHQATFSEEQLQSRRARFTVEVCINVVFYFVLHVVGS